MNINKVYPKRNSVALAMEIVFTQAVIYNTV